MLGKYRLRYWSFIGSRYWSYCKSANWHCIGLISALILDPCWVRYWCNVVRMLVRCRANIGFSIGLIGKLYQSNIGSANRHCIGLILAWCWIHAGSDIGAMSCRYCSNVGQISAPVMVFYRQPILVLLQKRKLALHWSDIGFDIGSMLGQILVQCRENVGAMSGKYWLFYWSYR